MKSFVIISEFNPFHNGHKYILDKSKSITNSDIAISFMSGDFVQRGEPALIDKFKRADTSIKEGFDIVIEMPNFISLQSAEFFASKSLQILGKLEIDYLCFGIEHIDSGAFLKYTDILYKKKQEMDEKIQENIKNGLSYTKSKYLAIDSIINNKEYISSNNILAFEYIDAINSLNLNIKPIAIERIGANNKDIDINNNKFASSTAIRKNINNKIENLLPKSSLDSIDIFKNEHDNFSNLNYFYDLFRYKLLIEENDLRNILCYEEGLENLFYRNAKSCLNYEQFIKMTTSSRFTSARIKRLMINYILDNRKLLNDINIDFIKILATSKKGMDYLKTKNIIKFISKKDRDLLDDSNKYVLDKMINASNLYNLSISKELFYDYKRKFKIQ